MEYKAKRSLVLENLKKELSRGFLEREVEVRGHKWVLHTLNEEDETWADSFVMTTSPSALIASRKAPRLAVAIKSVDNVSTASLFEYPDDMPKELKDELNKDPVRKRFWVRDQMLAFLNEDMHRPFIDDLHVKLMELEKERNDAITEIPKS